MGVGPQPPRRIGNCNWRSANDPAATLAPTNCSNPARTAASKEDARSMITSEKEERRRWITRGWTHIRSNRRPHCTAGAVTVACVGSSATADVARRVPSSAFWQMRSRYSGVPMGTADGAAEHQETVRAPRLGHARVDVLGRRRAERTPGLELARIGLVAGWADVVEKDVESSAY